MSISNEGLCQKNRLIIPQDGGLVVGTAIRTRELPDFGLDENIFQGIRLG
jgi:hypothetical protein